MRVVAIIALSFSFFALQDTEKKDCPGPDAKEHIQKPYHFTYESWVKKGTESYIFGRCVAVKNRPGMAVDWKKADVKGFADFEWPCHHELAAPFGTADEMVKGTLYFGAAPQKIDAPYREPKNQDGPAKGEKPPSDAEGKPSAKKSQSQKLVSRIKMALPEQIEVRSDFQVLKRVDLTFVSTVQEDREKYTYHYEITSNIDPRKEIPWLNKIRWQSPSAPLTSPADYPLDELFVREKSFKFSYSDHRPPTYGRSTVSFLINSPSSPSLMEIGSGSVGIYYPKID